MVVLEIGRHELYMNRVKCFKTLSAFVFHPSHPRTSLKRSCTSRPGTEPLLIPILDGGWMLGLSVAAAPLPGWCGTTHLFFYLFIYFFYFYFLNLVFVDRNRLLSPLTFAFGNLGRVNCMWPVPAQPYWPSAGERERERGQRYEGVGFIILL